MCMEKTATLEGVYVIDKPLGMSSQQAVARVKRWVRVCGGVQQIKVGHGGTLDPLATGVLVIAAGRTYTKTLNTVMGAQKEYKTVVRLGQTSTTDDEEGEKTAHDVIQAPTDDQVRHAVAQFVGHIIQTPPVYSAIKVGGVAAYKRVRRGQDVTLQPRTVRIDAIDVIAYAYPDLHLHVTCGKGTYIRALARDLGDALGTGAYMAELRRTRVGCYHIVDAQTLDDFDAEACYNETQRTMTVRKSDT